MKKQTQHGFFDVENRFAKLTKKKDPLVKLSLMIEWDRQGKSKRGDRFDELDIQYESLFAACGVKYIHRGKIRKSGR